MEGFFCKFFINYINLKLIIMKKMLIVILLFPVLVSDRSKEQNGNL